MENVKGAIPQDIIMKLSRKPLLRVDEVALFFAVSKMTVYRWYESGKLKGCNVAGTIRIYSESVIELMQIGDCKEAKKVKIKATRKISSGFVSRW